MNVAIEKNYLMLEFWIAIMNIWLIVETDPCLDKLLPLKELLQQLSKPQQEISWKPSKKLNGYPNSFKDSVYPKTFIKDC